MSGKTPRSVLFAFMLGTTFVLLGAGVMILGFLERGNSRSLGMGFGGFLFLLGALSVFAAIRERSRVLGVRPSTLLSDGRLHEGVVLLAVAVVAVIVIAVLFESPPRTYYFFVPGAIGLAGGARIALALAGAENAK